MFDDDFMDWVYGMPVGFMTHLWAKYNQRDIPVQGDNFVFVAPTEQFMQKRLGEIDLIEKLLMEDKITLKDLTRRSE